MTRRLLAALACCAAGIAAAPAAALALPVQFEEVELASGLSKPTAVAFAPDGRMFIAEQAGRVRVREADGTLRSAPLVDWADRVNAYGDRGMVGIATDRDFADNGFLYLLFVADDDEVDDDGPHSSRLVRVQVSADNEVVAEKTLLGGDTDKGQCGWPPPDGSHTTLGDAYLDCLPAWGTTHAIGTVASDPRDGTLWVGSGDATNVAFDDGNRPRRMQTYNEESFAGKILHIDREGRGLPGHPFCQGVSDRNRTCAKIHAKGFRNPFRFTIPTAPGAPPIVADVGNERREELNLARPGGNYGWPCWEGDDWRPGYYVNYATCKPYQQTVDGVVRPKDVDAPAFQYHHGDGDAAIQAGPVYEGDQYPAEYRGSLFFGDYAQGFIRRFPADGAGGWTIAPSSVESFDLPSSAELFTQRGAFTQLTSAPNGDLVVTDFLTFGPSGVGPGRVVRIAYTQSNLRPIAKASITCDDADAPCDEVDPGEPVAFTAEGSRDPDVDPIAYAWDFDGDGTTDSTAREPVRAFPDRGIHTVRLTVTDGRGGSADATVAVLAGERRPRVTIERPATETLYDGGAKVAFAGSATDAEDGELAPERLRWEIELVHGTHVHPVVDLAGRADGAFTAWQDHGLDSHYRLRLVARDSTGLEASATTTIRPRPADVRVDTSPSGVDVAVDDETVRTPATVRTASGLRSTLRAPETFVRDGRTWRFSGWDDGPASAERGYLVPRDGGALVARYVADPPASAPRTGQPSAPDAPVPGAGAPPSPAPLPPGEPRATPALRLTAPWPGRRRVARTVSGTLTGVDARPAIQVALARRAGTRCRWWTTRIRRFGRPASCRTPVWTTARVTRTAAGWRFDAPLRAAVARRPGTLRARATVSGRTVAQVTVSVTAAR